MTFARFILLTTSVLTPIIFFTRCSVLEAKKESAKKVDTGACFVEAFPSSVKPGESLQLRPAKSVSWDAYQSIRVENQSFDSANTTGINVTPKNSRIFVATAVLADGTNKSCNVEIVVEGHNFDASCSLVSDPSSVTANQDVNVTLQVLGTDAVEKSYVNEILVGGAAGGTRVFNVTATQTFVGRIESTDGKSTECALIVEHQKPIATGECKVEPSAEDIKLVSDGDEKFASENATAKAEKLAEQVAGREAHPVTNSDGLVFFSENSICKKITGQTAPENCSAVKSNNLGTVEYMLLDVNGQYYEVYGTYTNGAEVKIVKDTSGNPAPVIISPSREYVEEIEIEICECTYNSDSAATGKASDVAPPMAQIFWYPVSNTLRTSTYDGGTMHTYAEKKVFLKTKKVQPPPGVPKPQCPIDWNQAT
jgi:hypothetical protein